MSSVVVKHQSFAPGFVTVTPRAAHLVVIKLSRATLNCRIADRHLQHETRFGNLALLPQDADCSASVDAGVAETLTLTIDSGALAGFTETRCTPRDVLRGHDIPLAKLALSLDRIDAADSVARDHLAHRVLARITTRYGTGIPPGRGPALAPSKLQAVRDFIFDDVASDLSLSRLAEVAGLSPYHFARAFTRSTGVSPHRYIMQARADQAAAAVRIGRQSLADIAYDHGFTDQSHMCRWIRRRYGITPIVLRQVRSVH